MFAISLAPKDGDPHIALLALRLEGRARPEDRPREGCVRETEDRRPDGEPREAACIGERAEAKGELNHGCAGEGKNQCRDPTTLRKGSRRRGNQPRVASVPRA